LALRAVRQGISLRGRTRRYNVSVWGIYFLVLVKKWQIDAGDKYLGIGCFEFFRYNQCGVKKIVVLNALVSSKAGFGGRHTDFPFLIHADENRSNARQKLLLQNLQG
jgi:hypothetical protein